jgi:predicted nucleic acid-binding protein
VTAAGPGRHPRGLLDTSAVVDLDLIPDGALPAELAVSALTLAELAAGPHATTDPRLRSRRQEQLQRVEATFETVPFDGAAARAYGVVVATTASGGRTSRRRAVGLMIAAAAVAAGLPLFTRNAADVAGLDDILEVVQV